MGYYGPSFDWSTGFDTFTYAETPSFCIPGVGSSLTYPPFNSSDPEAEFEYPPVPSVVIPGASVVALVTKIEDFGGTIAIVPCGDYDGMEPRGWKPEIGKTTVVQGQCVYISVTSNSTNCTTNMVEIESALIGDFCARFPTAKVCKGHDSKATVPPALKLSKGVNASGSTSVPETKSGAAAANGGWTRSALFLSVAACLTLAVGSL